MFSSLIVHTQPIRSPRSWVTRSAYSPKRAADLGLGESLLVRD